MPNYDLSSQAAIASAAKEVRKEREELYRVGNETGVYDTRLAASLQIREWAFEECAKQLERQQKLVDTVLNYLAEHHDNSELYEMFHEDMGLSHDDIEFLGFDLSDCYKGIESMVVESWEDMQEKYQMDRAEMTEEEEIQFVEDCFKLYEKEGFSPIFWSPFTDNAERVGLPVEIVGRVEADSVHDLTSLPMWKARLDGCEFEVFPEEVVPSEMKSNGCRWFADVLTYDGESAAQMSGLDVDVMSPQESADTFGKAVRDGRQFYFPKNFQETQGPLCCAHHLNVDDKRGMKAVKIEWDVDCDEDRALLPTEIEIPKGMVDEDEISDYLSDVTGYCHKGYKLIGSQKKSLYSQIHSASTRAAGTPSTATTPNKDQEPKL